MNISDFNLLQTKKLDRSRNKNTYGFPDVVKGELTLTALDTTEITSLWKRFKKRRYN